MCSVAVFFLGAEARRKRAAANDGVSFIQTIGEEGDCSDSADVYCNGYLNPKTAYKCVWTIRSNATTLIEIVKRAPKANFYGKNGCLVQLMFLP